MTYAWIQTTEQQKRDYTWHNQLIKDTMTLLKKHLDAFLFNEEQVAIIEKLCQEKQYNIKIILGDGYYIVFRKEENK